MKKYFLMPLTTSLFFGVLTYAQDRCETVFEPGPSEFYASTAKVIGIEWNTSLNDRNMKIVDEVINQNRPFTLEDHRIFKTDILDYFEYYDAVQKREAESLLARKLSRQEAVALRLARALGRTEKGQNPDILAFSGNYTQKQIARKDRVLELAGFPLQERVALIGNKMVDDVLTKYAAENLMLDQSIAINKDPALAIRMNQELLKQMKDESLLKTPDSKRIQSLSQSEASDLYEAVTRHPVARLLNVNQYEKNPDSKIGFCFGRAMTAHLEALSRGIDKDSLRKIFVVGRMKALVGDITWQFHVATAVKNKDGGWWVIDPFFGKAASLEVWYQKMYKQDASGTLRIYSTEAARFAADGTDRYNKIHIMSNFYFGYFRDLMAYYSEKSKGKLQPKDMKTKVFDWALSALRLGI